ncbi:MAG TPA: hypothetical protein V6D17_14775 [Candidatus Obscuribacterales bacterium]
MFRHRNFLAAAIAAALISAGFSPAAQANDLQNILRNYLGFNLPVFRGNAQLESSLSARRAQLEALITYGVTSGRLSQSQAQAFRLQLSQIANLEASYKADGSLSIAESQTISNWLAQIDGSLNMSINGTANFNVPPRRPYMSPYPSIRSNIDRLLLSLEQGRADGRISLNEYSLFRDQLTGLSLKESALSRESGRWSERDYHSLMGRVSRLDSLITSALTSRQFAQDGNRRQRRGDWF